MAGNRRCFEAGSALIGDAYGVCFVGEICSSTGIPASVPDAYLFAGVVA